MAKIIVITGGIGSGKSEVCKILARNGYSAQYDADSRVKRLYAESDTLVPELEDALGIPLRNDVGAFVPALMARRIFSDMAALEMVENIVFPALISDFEDFIRTSDSDYVIFESATVLEKPFFANFGDAVILVTAPFDVRLRRAMLRDNATQEAVVARMNNQKMMNAFADCSAFQPESPWYSAYSRIDAFVDTDCPMDQMEKRVLNAMKIVETKML